jgi:hypothetical protein
LNIIDQVMVYRFIKLMATPFKQWKAYSLGIIDKDGNQLKQISELKTQAEHDAFGYIQLLGLNLRRILAKVAGGNAIIGSLAGVLLLMREQPKLVHKEEELLDYIHEAMELHESYITEDGGDVAPVNTAGSGHVAGLGVGPQGEPPMRQPKPITNKYKRANERDTKKMLGTVATILKRTPQ